MAEGRGVAFSAHAWDDYLHWLTTDEGMLKRLNRLIEECRRTPFSGTGKPEPLRGSLAGHWSRRLSPEHRLVYRVTDDRILLVQCRFHY